MGEGFSDKGVGCGWGREVFWGRVDGSCSENFSDPGEEGRRLHANQEPPEAWGGGEKDRNRNGAGGRGMDLGRRWEAARTETPENHRPASPRGPAALICLSHHDSWVPRASHTPALVLTNPP